MVVAPEAEAVEQFLRAHSSDNEREKIVRRLSGGLDAIGVRMKDVFALAKTRKDGPLDAIPPMLDSPWYEVRMVAMAILDFKARGRVGTDVRGALFDTYIDHHDRIVEWDLVDRAAPRVLGGYLIDRGNRCLTWPTPRLRWNGAAPSPGRSG